jgi:hypothetical protein
LKFICGTLSSKDNVYEALKIITIFKMIKTTILVVGLEQKEITTLRQKLGFGYIVLHHDTLPKLKLVDGKLYVASLTVLDKFIAVDKVIFHGIFENDFDALTLLALWNGACLPDAQGMMDLRLRIPGLARALRVSKFGGIKRSMVIGQQKWFSQSEVIAKWGIWHCGEDKHKFHGEWTSSETSVIESFIHGEAVRIMLVGDKYWQIKLTGDTWLKSIHHEDSSEITVDKDLLEDTKNLSRHFNLDIVGVDYMVGHNGEKYLLEVNHIPNVTIFPFMNEAFLEYAVHWVTNSKL